MNEDAFPIENGDFSNVMLVFRGVPLYFPLLMGRMMTSTVPHFGRDRFEK